jgi:hypothetical protein
VADRPKDGRRGRRRRHRARRASAACEAVPHGPAAARGNTFIEALAPKPCGGKIMV